MKTDRLSWLLPAVLAVIAAYYWYVAPVEPAPTPEPAPAPLPRPARPCPGPYCPEPEGRVYGAPAPLARPARPTSPAWPVGRTLRHQEEGLTTHFASGGACAVCDGRRAFDGRWRFDLDDGRRVIVFYGRDWDRDGKPFWVAYRHQE